MGMSDGGADFSKGNRKDEAFVLKIDSSCCVLVLFTVKLNFACHWRQESSCLELILKSTPLQFQ